MAEKPRNTKWALWATFMHVFVCAHIAQEKPVASHASPPAAEVAGHGESEDSLSSTKKRSNASKVTTWWLHKEVGLPNKVNKGSSEKHKANEEPIRIKQHSSWWTKHTKASDAKDQPKVSNATKVPKKALKAISETKFKVPRCVTRSPKKPRKESDTAIKAICKALAATIIHNVVGGHKGAVVSAGAQPQGAPHGPNTQTSTTRTLTRVSMNDSVNKAITSAATALRNGAKRSFRAVAGDAALSKHERDQPASTRSGPEASKAPMDKRMAALARLLPARLSTRA